MKEILLIFGFVCLVFVDLYGQRNIPRNLKQTISLLDENFPDSLKTIIKITEDKDLKALSYPYGNQYKTIYNWLSNEKSGIYKYLTSKGINNFHTEVILENYKRYLLHKTMNEDSLLRPYLEIERKWRIEDENKAIADTLRGVYIPRDINDCFVQINSFWDDSMKVKAKHLEEEVFMGRVHLGFGMWIRNNWRLWAGSRLSIYFNDLGIYHPDDMSGIILTSYHRYLNNNEIKLMEQVKFYQDYWKDSKQKALKRKQEEFSKYPIGDTLEFKYNRGFVNKRQEDLYDNDSCIARGVITERNDKDFLIKVKAIETCDKKGIIYYDNDGYRIYDPKTKKTSDPPKRIIKKMKVNDEQWFEFDDWEVL